MARFRKNDFFKWTHILIFYSKTTNKLWLEANTERSESNPGRSLGIITSSKKSCLEDSTKQIKHQ